MVFIATDITDSESFAFSVAAITLEVVKGRLKDIGYARFTAQAIVIGVDNDATIRIASDAASAKRALHILRRLGHARYMTDNDDITARKIDRALNVADVGTHYLTGTEMRTLEARLRGDTSAM